VDGTGSGSCLVAGLGVSSVEARGPPTRELINLHAVLQRSACCVLHAGIIFRS
jgi:hypothetical protein